MADNLIVSNNGVSTIDGGLSSTATTLILNDISLMPVLTNVDDYCILTLIRQSDGSIEYVRCTSQDVPNRSYEILRGQEDTTALVFTDGDEVRNLLTKGQIDGFLKEPDGFNNYLKGLTNNGGISALVGDIDQDSDVLGTSLYRVTKAGNTGTFPDELSTESCFLYTYANNVNSSIGQQTLITQQTSPKMWMRIQTGNIWQPWKQLAILNDVVPISGNASNPMTGELYVGSDSRFGDNSMDLGQREDVNSSFINLLATGDASQTSYSTRIIRNNGVDGTFSIVNQGTGGFQLRNDAGEIFIQSGANISLYTPNGTVDVLSSRITSVASPVNSDDAATKAYVDNSAGVARWAYVTNGSNSSPTISAGAGISSIQRLSTGQYTFNLSTNVSTNNANILVEFTPIATNTYPGDRAVMSYDKDISNTSTIYCTCYNPNSSSGNADADRFIIRLTELS